MGIYAAVSINSLAQYLEDRQQCCVIMPVIVIAVVLLSFGYELPFLGLNSDYEWS